MTERSLDTILVSDHAVLRYLERVEGWDIAALRDALARSAAVGVAHGSRVVVIAGAKLILDENRVVTVIRIDQKASHAREVEIRAPIQRQRRPKRRRG